MKNDLVQKKVGAYCFHRFYNFCGMHFIYFWPISLFLHNICLENKRNREVSYLVKEKRDVSELVCFL
jgi:hypothetical protein